MHRPWIRDLAQRLGLPRKPRRRLRRPQLQSEALEPRYVFAASVLAPIADMTIASSQGATNLDLFKYLGDTNIAGTVTQWTTPQGVFYVDLFDSVTPITVQNFLNYVQAGLYNDPTWGDTFFHRLEPNFVLQGGGFRWDGSDDNEIDSLPQIPNEFAKIRAATPSNQWVNTRGTIAMAKMSGPDEGGPLNGGADSATNQWFFNLRNNGSNLDTQNGGFTTFGRVLFDGMSVVDGIASLSRYNQPTPLSGIVYESVPLSNYTAGQPVQTNNLALIQDISVVPELSFQIISNSNSSLVTASLDNGRLTLNHQGSTTGSATITVRATDLLGGTVDETFVVTYAASGNRAPTIAQAIPDTNLAEATIDRNLTYNLNTRFTDADLAGGDALTYSVVANNNPRLITPSFNGTSFTAKINADQHGAATVTVRATDKTGAFVDETFVVTITSINNAPEALIFFGDRTYFEDFGFFKLNPFNEPVVDEQNNQFTLPMFTDIDLFTDQDHLTFTVSANSNPGIITTSFGEREIYFDSVPDAHGATTLTIRATDQGGQYAEISFTVTVLPVNDAPSFSLQEEHGSLAGAGTQTVPNFATNVSAGLNESTQTLTFEIVNYTNPTLFATPPSIAPDGTLTYKLVDNKLESSQITVWLKDNGGTANGGVNQSGSQTFLIHALNPWQNPANRFEIDGIPGVNAFDVLMLVNEVRNPVYSNAAHQLPFPRPQAAAPYFDVDGVLSGGVPVVSAFDVLDLVNYLRSGQAAATTMQAAENEASTASVATGGVILIGWTPSDWPLKSQDATLTASIGNVIFLQEIQAAAGEEIIEDSINVAPPSEEDEALPLDPVAADEVFGDWGGAESEEESDEAADLPLTVGEEARSGAGL